jgi:hypothetical protein
MLADDFLALTFDSHSCNSVLHETFALLPETNVGGFSHQQFSIRDFLHDIKGDGSTRWDRDLLQT